MPTQHRCVALLALCIAGSFAAHYDYGATLGPAEWPALYPTCAAAGNAARQQSPIDLSALASASLGAASIATAAAHWDTRYGIVDQEARLTTHVDLRSVGVTAAITLPSASVAEYHLVAATFRKPAEHTVGGTRADLEVQYTFAGFNGSTVMVAELYNSASSAASDSALVAAVASQRAGDAFVPVAAATTPVSSSGAFYRYTGSSTFPPCKAGVEWLVLQAVGNVAATDLAQFVGNANRPVQAMMSSSAVATSDRVTVTASHTAAGTAFPAAASVASADWMMNKKFIVPSVTNEIVTHVMLRSLFYTLLVMVIVMVAFVVVVIAARNVYKPQTRSNWVQPNTKAELFGFAASRHQTDFSDDDASDEEFAEDEEGEEEEEEEED
jgi:carbonic anhydrase